MALIDVAELLSDPDFIDPVSIVHQVSAVNTFGQNVIVETTVDTFGSVQPASGKTIQRLPEALRVANVSSFWVRGEIKATSSGSVYPDILVFGTKRYQVQMVFDYTNWGSGWCEGTCVAENPGG